MPEWLAIKSDKNRCWTDAAAEEKAARDLEPLDGEDSKSSWAHVLEDSCFEECFRGEPRATRALQALAILIFVEHRNPGVRSQVLGVSLLRSALDDSVVLEDRWTHPVTDFDSTHRSIKANTAEDRHRIVRMILARSGVQAWKYSREQLLPLLDRLLEKGLVRDGYLATAHNLLARGSGR